LSNIVFFCNLLRQAGLPVSVEQTLNFTEALTLVDIGSRSQVFFAARGLLVSRKEHLELFEVLFNRFWTRHGRFSRSGGQKAPLAPRHLPQAKKYASPLSLMASGAGESDPEVDVADKSGTFSAAEVLQRKHFSEMTPAELDTIKKLIQEMQWHISRRKTHRYIHDARGNMLHLRRILRSAARHQGVIWNLHRQDRKIKQRPLVLVADISGSMEKYSRLMLQFFYSVTHRFRNVESFVFGTRLTRLTAQLRLRNIDRAIEGAGSEVVDWSGGTRIGDSLKTFNRQWGRRVLGRGAIVMIISDGWDRGDVSLLKQEMRSLNRRCYRLIWLNPLLGTQGYQPLVAGMAAALPFVDDFLPIHNLQSLLFLSAYLGKLGPRRSRLPVLKTG
jgi:uncharacterized protein with von Willebrand factor type A (vWA) domain